jgi:glycosyltransferase involved in cell wall biosynthesis
VSSHALRILVTCDWFAPHTGGGAERVAFEVSRRLAAAGHRITILATRTNGDDAFDLTPGIDLVTVHAHDLARLLRAQVSVSPALFAATPRTIEAVRPDVVWGHSLQFQTTPIAAASARRARVPFVVTAHIGDLRAVAGPIGFAARVHEATIGHAILRLSTRAFAVSEAVAAHLRSIERRLTIDVIPNGVDLSRFTPGDSAPHDSLRVGFLGRLVRNKGPEVAVRAIAEAVRGGVDASLSFAGEGPERASLERLAARAGIRDRVHFEGYRPDPEAWFQRIDVLVRPSVTEGMPLGVLEAMAAGVPVVASDIPGNASLVRNCESGVLVPIGDHVALAQGLHRLSRDPEFRARMREAGLRIAREHSWDRTAELTLQGFERAISDPAALARGSMRATP